MQSEEYKAVRHSPPMPGSEEAKKVLGDDVSLLQELQISALSEEDIDHIWDHYDADRSDQLTRDELEALLVDISKYVVVRPSGVEKCTKMEATTLTVLSNTMQAQSRPWKRAGSSGQRGV
eukprot:scaffold1311_cov256-Pinguiococcus_pyrenoidosus.AAC.46